MSNFNDMYKIHFAPLQGYTEDIYRRAHAEIFGGVESYTTPFVRCEHKEVRGKDLRDIDPAHNDGVNLIPQVIADGGEELRLLLEPIRAYGYRHVDINMGCPFPLQTRHHRGCGILPCPELAGQICDVVKEYPDISFSVKMRLGLEAPDEWKGILPILNDTPLAHITLHPRVGRQQYGGAPDMVSFDEFLGSCAHPVIYNADIRSIEQIEGLEREYGDRISAVMIGRGLLARPSLALEYQRGREMEDSELLEKVLLLHGRIMEQYEKAIPDPNHRLRKIQTFWDYLEPVTGRRSQKALQKAGNMKNYLKALEDLGVFHIFTRNTQPTSIVSR